MNGAFGAQRLADLNIDSSVAARAEHLVEMLLQPPDPESAEAIRDAVLLFATATSITPAARDEALTARLDWAVAHYPLIRDFGVLQPRQRVDASVFASIGRALDLAYLQDLRLPHRRLSVRHTSA